MCFKEHLYTLDCNAVYYYVGEKLECCERWFVVIPNSRYFESFFIVDFFVLICPIHYFVFGKIQLILYLDYLHIVWWLFFIVFLSERIG
jgi:hypothetical protein